MSKQKTSDRPDLSSQQAGKGEATRQAAVKPAQKKEKKTVQRETLERVLLYIRPYRTQVILSLVLAAISVAGQLLIPLLTGDAIDTMLGSGQVDFISLGKILMYLALYIAFSAAAQYVMGLCNNRITYSVTRDLRNEVSEKIERLPLSYLDSHLTGDIVSRMVADVDAFSDGLLMGFTQLFTGVLTILGTLVFMIRVDFRIAIVVVFVTPLSFFVASFIAKRTFRWFHLQGDIRGEETALINERIDGLKVVRAFGVEDLTVGEFDDVNTRLGDAALKATFFSSITNPATRFVNSVVYALVALAGSLFAAAGGITVGQLSIFLTYANQYTKPFNEISGVVTELQNALACASRIFDLLDAEEDVKDAENARTLAQEEVGGRVAIEDISFRYVPDRPLIEGFDLAVEPGTRVAIVGPTGCGKTTLINLLMRFYDVDAGRIAVEGTDIRDITRRSLRASYGMVLQETWLTSGTIHDNIAYGRPDATREEVIEAARKAHAHSFIRRLKDGYDTVITEGGDALSQGEKQLLCIARVMLCLPPMLILDEATSSIDTRTEMRIQKAFNTMMEGRTSFIVAHRLSTIREADVILVMRDGHIVEQGTHDSLLKRGGFYSKLYMSQFEGVAI